MPLEAYTALHVAPPTRFVPVTIHMPSELRAQLEQLADDDGRSLSNLCMHVLYEWVAGRRYVPECLAGRGEEV